MAVGVVAVTGALSVLVPSGVGDVVGEVEKWSIEPEWVIVVTIDVVVDMAVTEVSCW